MNIKEGDTVRFLNDIGGGVVTKIIDRFSVEITNEDGFDIPVKISELVVIDDVEYSSSSKNNDIHNEKETEIDINTDNIFYPDVNFDNKLGDDINVYFAFVPQGKAGNSNLNLYLINDSNYNILYSFIDIDNTNKGYSNAVGVIDANTKEQIGTLGFDSINNISEYIFHLIFYKKGEFKLKSPIDKSFKVNPVKFYKEKSYKESDYFNEDVILFSIISENTMLNELENITEKEFKQIIKQKEKIEKPQNHKSPKKTEQLEIDLHIHELLDDFKGLSNREILDIQMDKFNYELDNAKKTHIKKIVFIHGVGEGKLKHNIRRELDKNKNKYTYQDASFKEYGYGATMVYLK